MDEQDWTVLHTAKDIDGNEPGGCSLTFRGNVHDDDVAFMSEKIAELMKILDEKRRTREGKTKNRPYHWVCKRLPPI